MHNKPSAHPLALHYYYYNAAVFLYSEVLDSPSEILGVGCSVVEWVKRSTPRWFGYIERMENEEFVKKVYLRSVEGPHRKGGPLGRWEDRMKKKVSERGVR